MFKSQGKVKKRQNMPLFSSAWPIEEQWSKNNLVYSRDPFLSAKYEGPKLC